VQAAARDDGQPALDALVGEGLGVGEPQRHHEPDHAPAAVGGR